jgi:hypothetical protein
MFSRIQPEQSSGFQEAGIMRRYYTRDGLLPRDIIAAQIAPALREMSPGMIGTFTSAYLDSAASRF